MWSSKDTRRMAVEDTYRSKHEIERDILRALFESRPAGLKKLHLMQRAMLNQDQQVRYTTKLLEAEKIAYDDQLFTITAKGIMQLEKLKVLDDEKEKVGAHA